MQYPNEHIIQQVDEVANRILSEQRTNHHRDKFFPALIDSLNLKTGAEIGVDKGEFSCHILEKSSIERYYCIDTWQDDFGSDHRPDAYDPLGDNRLTIAKQNLSNHLAAKRVALMRMTSLEAAQKFPKESIDFCYIDGDHSLEGIYSDIKAWLPKVKIGGIIAGHDYKDGPDSGIKGFDGKQLPYRIKTVVDDYCVRYGYSVNSVGGRILSWWFVKNQPAKDDVNLHLLENPGE